MSQRSAVVLVVVALAAAAACGGGTPEATSTLVPAPTIPTAPAPVEDQGAVTALVLGPLYNADSLERLPTGEPFSLREVVEAIDADPDFTVHRLAVAGSPFPVLVTVCSPRAPDGAVFQTRHASGAVATVFAWAYDDVTAIADDWVEVDGALKMRPPPQTPEATATADATAAGDTPTPDAATPAATATPTPDEEPPCTATMTIARGMIGSLRHDNLVVILTRDSPHPGAIYTSAGANEELLDIIRHLEAAP